jgi:sigma-B regulation protein RsbU (phosphoserine phosphatase)
LRRYLPESHLSWLPRDIVGGDCYFFRPTKDGLFGAIIDCTGHGVPGAFMTLITLSYLENQIGVGGEELDPATILNGLNRYIKNALGQNSAYANSTTAAMNKSDDGLDAFMFVLTEQGRTLQYAAARLEMAIVQADEEAVDVLEGDKMGVGYSDTPDDFAFSSRRARLEPGFRALITTDGIIDQIGGPKNIAFGRKRLYQLLAENRRLRPEEFGPLLLDRLALWQGAQTRRDDVCFFSFMGA